MHTKKSAKLELREFVSRIENRSINAIVELMWDACWESETMLQTLYNTSRELGYSDDGEPFNGDSDMGDLFNEELRKRIVKAVRTLK